MKKTAVIFILLTGILFTGCSLAGHKVDERYISFCLKEGKIEIFYMNTVEIITSVKSSYEGDTLVLDIRVAHGSSDKKYYVGVDDKVSYIKVGKKIFNVRNIEECYTGKTIP